MKTADKKIENIKRIEVRKILISTSIGKEVRGRKEYINCDLTAAKRFLYSLQVE